MDPAAIAQLMIAAMQLATKFAETYPAIRDSFNATDRAELDRLHAELSAKSNAVADRLRATPDDPA